MSKLIRNRSKSSFFLKERKHNLLKNSLAKNLIEKETLDLDSIIEILGERPFEIKTNFKAFLESKNLTKA